MLKLKLTNLTNFIVDVLNLNAFQETEISLACCLSTFSIWIVFWRTWIYLLLFSSYLIHYYRCNNVNNDYVLPLWLKQFYVILEISFVPCLLIPIAVHLVFPFLRGVTPYNNHKVYPRSLLRLCNTQVYHVVVKEWNYWFHFIPSNSNVMFLAWPHILDHTSLQYRLNPWTSLSQRRFRTPATLILASTLPRSSYLGLYLWATYSFPKSRAQITF